MLAGRPTDYRDEYCELVKDIGREGGTIYEMADACDVIANTLYVWAQEHPIFKEAFTRAKELSKSWYSQNLRKNLTNPNFQVKAVELACKFMIHMPTYQAIVLPQLKDAKTFEEKCRIIICAVVQNEIDVDVGKKIADTLAVAANIKQVDELKEVLDDLKKSIETIKGEGGI